MTRATTAFPALTDGQEALRNTGWGIEETGPDEHVYVRPDGINRADGGEFGTDWLWELQEALEDAEGTA